MSHQLYGNMFIVIEIFTWKNNIHIPDTTYFTQIWMLTDNYYQ